MPSACTIWKRNTKYLCLTCGKSVCVRVEFSIAEGVSQKLRPKI